MHKRGCCGNCKYSAYCGCSELVVGIASMGKLSDFDTFDCRQIAREHRDWGVDDWKRVAWSDASRFRLINADGKLIIWCQAHEAMDLAY
ncbi:hypothetical protein TNCV_2319871 [Trichonephila clavipes]|nr:hypothetical protein TNCV_2319871 [Trichonephila clavipes]